MRLALLALMATTALTLALAPAAAHAAAAKTQDRVELPLTVEGWVTTKTALVQIGVEAVVKDGNAGKLRDDMQKAVMGLASKADWRLVNFNRSQDSTGLEHWSASYQARVEDADLGGLADKVKSASKAGMQLAVQMTSFTPSLAEYEARRADLRRQIYAAANTEVAQLNQAMPGREFRIGEIDFTQNGAPPHAPVPVAMFKAARANTMAMAADASAPEEASAEVADKIVMTAEVTLVTGQRGADDAKDK